MRIDPESPRAKAKMRALDKLSDMMDYSNTKRREIKGQDPGDEVREQERDIHATGVGESQMDSGNDRNPDDFSSERARRIAEEDDMHTMDESDADDRYLNHRDDGDMVDDNGDDGEPPDVNEAAEALGTPHTTINMRRLNRSPGGMDGLKKAAHLMPDGPPDQDSNHPNRNMPKKHRR